MPVQPWRQLKGSDFRPAAAIAEGAGRQFNAGFGALNKALEGYQAGRTQENTEAMQSGIQSFADLAALNEAQNRGDYNIGSIREQYGALVDPSKAAAALTTQRNQLRDSALNEAALVGRDVASNTGDLTQGSEAIFKSLVDKGANTQWAQEQANSWAKNAGSLSDTLNQQNKAKADELFRTNIAGAKSAEEANTLISQAPVEMQGRLRELAGQQSTAKAADIATEAAAYAKRRRRLGDTRADNKYESDQRIDNSLGMIAEGADVATATAGLQGAEAIKVQSQAKQHKINQQKLTPTQEAEVENTYANEMNTANDQVMTRQRGISAQQAVVDNIPVTINPQIAEQFVNIKNPDDHAEKLIMEDMRKIWGGGFLDWVNKRSSLKNFKDNVSSLKKEFSNLEDDEFAALLYQSWSDTYMDQRDQLFAGIDFGVLGPNMKDRVKTMNARKAEQTKLSNLKLDNQIAFTKDKNTAIDNKFKNTKSVATGGKVNPFVKAVSKTVKPVATKEKPADKYFK